jgi:hypothetical protein
MNINTSAQKKPQIIKCYMSVYLLSLSIFYQASLIPKILEILYEF